MVAELEMSPEKVAYNSWIRYLGFLDFHGKWTLRWWSLIIYSARRPGSKYDHGTKNQRWLQSIQALTKVTDATIGAPLAYAAVLRHPLHLRSAYANECPVLKDSEASKMFF